MKMYELDICTEDISLDKAVKKLESFKGVSIIMVSQNGFGSGWPTVKFTADEAGLKKVEKWYGDSLE